MEVVTGAMGTLLPKLADLIKEEFNLQKKVRGQIMFLKTELEYMEAALIKVSEMPIDRPPDIQLKLWTRDVRELSYDLEDSIDTFKVHIDTPRQLKEKQFSLGALVERSMKLLTRAKIHHKLGVNIEEIRSRVQEVSALRDRYRIDSIIAAEPSGETVDTHRLSAALYTKAEDLIGVEKKSDELVRELMEGDEASKQQLKIISIVGFGGLGKTTLAKRVHDKLKDQFDCGAFVSVSLNPNIKNIFTRMLYQLGHCKYEATWDEDQFINELREFLRDKRYFIVIDDIWKTSVWKRIQYALVENKCGSRIISTTRYHDVANNVGGVYVLQPLSPADSKKLFYLRIFGNETSCPPNELNEVSDKILKKCGGVPLAIITVASMLASKKRKENIHEYWSKVYKTLGSGLEDSPDIDNMRMILSISYSDLPPHLKPCMLYLSSYPEDTVINIQNLIWKWVDEGFIIPDKLGRSILEVGEDYVDELISRSMIQPEYINRDCDKATHCRVHDMVLDAITRLSKEEGFLTILRGQKLTHLPERIRRLFLQICNEEDINQLLTVSFSHVRSLTVSRGPFNLLLAPLTLPVLRVLDLSHCGKLDNHYFKDICNMLHLRSLRICYTDINKIPKEIRKLKLLQVLDMVGTGVQKLPSTFIQLRELLYIRVDSLTELPDGFGNLKYLQELHGTITMDSSTMMHNLVGLTDLRCLNLLFNEWDKSYEKLFLQCLSSLVSLEYLELAGSNGEIGSRYEKLTPEPERLQNINMASSTIHAVPRWMPSLSTLSILCISLLTVGEEDFHVLGSIPSLSHLQLSVEEPTQSRDKKLAINNAYPFLCLTKFEICNITGVMFMKGAMPKLKNLLLAFGVLETLDLFGDYDFGLENLSSLVHVDAVMGCVKAKSEKVKAAEDAIRNVLYINPNKPTLNSMKITILVKSLKEIRGQLFTTLDFVVCLSHLFVYMFIYLFTHHLLDFCLFESKRQATDTYF